MASTSIDLSSLLADIKIKVNKKKAKKAQSTPTELPQSDLFPAEPAEHVPSLHDGTNDGLVDTTQYYWVVRTHDFSLHVITERKFTGMEFEEYARANNLSEYEPIVFTGTPSGE